MSREEISDTVDFTSQGITGPTVLSTDDLEFDARNGMRFSAAMQLRGGRNLEFSILDSSAGLTVQRLRIQVVISSRS